VIHLVRHAHAGKRGSHDNERQRPLTELGKRQAKSIAEIIALAGVSRILSSPFARCVQTMGPLSDAVGLPVEEDPRLAEGQDVGPLLALLHTDGLAICSHGDVMNALLEAIAASGVPIGEPQFEKGAIWAFDLDAGGDLRHPRYTPPSS
jgi:phosphohistidine phosphatase SixA